MSEPCTAPHAAAPAEPGPWRAGARRALRLCSWPLVQLLVLLIRGYQLLISPATRPRCRFEPSCSCYAIESLHKDGLVKGLLKSAWRLCRCQPFGTGGYDPP